MEGGGAVRTRLVSHVFGRKDAVWCLLRTWAWGATARSQGFCRGMGSRVSVLFGGGGGVIDAAVQAFNRLLGLGRGWGVCRVGLGVLITQYANIGAARAAWVRGNKLCQVLVVICWVR